MKQIIYLIRAFWHSLISKKRSDWQIVLACLGLATLIWLFKAFSKSYIYPARFELSILYPSRKFIAHHPPPTHVDIYIKARGFRHIEHALLARFRPLRFDLDTQKPNLLDVNRILAAIKESEPHLLPSDSNLKPIVLPFSKRTFRRVFLALNKSRISVQPGYGIYGSVRISPASVVYSGLDSILAALPDTHWLALDGRGLSAGKFDKIVDICNNRSARMSCNPQTARLELNVVAYVNLQTIKKPILKNWPKKRNPKKTQIICSYQIAQPDVAKMRTLASKSFVLLADYNARNSQGLVPIIVISSSSKIVGFRTDHAYLRVPK